MKEAEFQIAFKNRRREFLKGMLFAGIEITGAPTAPVSARSSLVLAGLSTGVFAILGIPRAREAGLIVGTGALFGKVIR